MPESGAAHTPIAERVKRMELVFAKPPLNKIRTHLVREKPFNKRRAINTEMREVKQELETLIRASTRSE